MNKTDHENIKKDAKLIMDNFMNSLKDIEVEHDFQFKKEVCFRDEKGSNNQTNENFKQLFLNNAPRIKGDAILTKKGKWVK